MDVSKLPAPVSETWEWQLSGSCRAEEPSTFFHPPGERGMRRERRETNAKRICSSCPVIQQCRAWALRTEETYGIWGGLGEGEREQLFQEASRARREVAA